MLALQQGKTGIGALSEGQKDQLIEVMKRNEDHAFQFYTRQLDSDKEIELARIHAGIFNQKTDRIVFITAAFVLSAITVLILLARETYFTPWLSFIAGLIGGGLSGYGYAKAKKTSKGEDLDE